MGYEFVEIGYFGTDSETEWQRQNEAWVDQYMPAVGKYMVNIDSAEFIENEDVIYHESWDALIPVVKKINENLKGETRDGSFVYPYRMMEALKDCNIELVHFNAAKCIKWLNDNPK